jgi:hypothetical protein
VLEAEVVLAALDELLEVALSPAPPFPVEPPVAPPNPPLPSCVPVAHDPAATPAMISVKKAVTEPRMRHLTASGYQARAALDSRFGPLLVACG